MKLRSIRWRLPISYIGIALLAALAAGVFMLAALRNYYRQQERAYLERNAQPFAQAAGQLLQAGVSEDVLQDQATSWSFLLQARVQLYDMQDELLADSGTPQTQQVLMVSNLPGQTFETHTVTGEVSTPLTDTVTFSELSPGDPYPPGNPYPQANIIMMSAGQAGGMGDVNERSDVIVVNGCPPDETGVGVCSTGIVAGGELVSGTGTFTQPVAVGMPLVSSFYGFEMDTSDAHSLERSNQHVEQVLLDAAGNALGALVVSEGPAYGAEIVRNVRGAWAVASGIALAVAGATGWLVSRRILSPVIHLTQVTARMADGDLAARVSAGARSGADSDDEFEALGRSFDLMAERIQEMVETLRRFMADAAHELNTPITALRTDLELAQAASRQEERSQLNGHALDQVGRLQGMVSNLLGLSRLEGQAGRTQHRPVDLVELVEGLAESYASRAEQAELSFDLALPSGPVMLNGDAAQLRTALENLLDNAIKFTPSGGSVCLSLNLEGGQAVVTVEDTGIGIPEEDLSSLFKRFHRGRNASAYPGSGLGLPIVEQIARLHGGSVSVENAKSGGLKTKPGVRVVMRLGDKG
jgi:signal transduction histidine kinase